MSKLTLPSSLAGKSSDPAAFMGALLSDYAALAADTADFTNIKHRVEKIRDLSVIRLMGDLMLVIACDSNAGCGEKEKDFFQWPYEEAVAGMFKVPMMEVLASGAVADRTRRKLE